MEVKPPEFLKNKKSAIEIGTLVIFIALVLVAAVSAAVITNTAARKLQEEESSECKENTVQVARGIHVFKVVGYADNVSTNSALNITGTMVIINHSNYINRTDCHQYKYIKGIAVFVGPNIGDEFDLSSITIMLSNNDKSVSIRYSGIIEYDNCNGAETIFKGLELLGANESVITTKIDITNGTSIKGDYIVINNSNEIVVGKNGWVLNDAPKFGIIVLRDSDKSLYGEHPLINYGDKVVLTINTGTIFEQGISTGEKVYGEVIPEYSESGIIEFRTPLVFNRRVMALQ